jgi:hypothetical protein
LLEGRGSALLCELGCPQAVDAAATKPGWVRWRIVGAAGGLALLVFASARRGLWLSAPSNLAERQHRILG